MRRGELLGLRWSDIDLKASRLTVNQSLERLRGKTTFKAPKTQGSRRTITLPALTVVALKDHRAQHPRIGAGELVFSHEGIPWDPDSLTKAFDRLIAATGVRRITFHGLRHTHISHQLMDGVHVKVVSEGAGHANVAITLSVYAAFVPTLQADAAQGVDRWLRQELADQVGGKSVAIQPFPAKRDEPSD
jgi:integrase